MFNEFKMQLDVKAQESGSVYILITCFIAAGLYAAWMLILYKSYKEDIRRLEVLKKRA